MNMLELCRRDLVSLSGDATAGDAARAMRDRHVGCILVTDPLRPGRVTGILTDRDLVVGPLAEELPAEDLAVGPLSRRELAGVRADATVREAAEAMHRAGVRRLLVTHPDGSVAGIVSMDDLLDAMALQFEALAGALHSGMSRESTRMPHAAAITPPGVLYLTRNEP